VTAVVGWDIGGVNTKAVRIAWGLPAPPLRAICRPFEVQRQPEALALTLTTVAEELDTEPGDRHAVTMTAELSQAFRTKREGVAFVLDALEHALPARTLQVYTVGGEFVSPAEARAHPQEVAASNWSATANWVARSIPTCVLIDIGTTSTDLIPVVNGKVVARGHTDPERLLSGELVYTGALRTPVEAITRRVPLWGGSAGVSAERFALIGDAHLWLGRLSPEDYTCPTPDGRPVTREHAAERLARTVCADRDMLGDSDIADLAIALAQAQVETIAEALERTRQRWPEIGMAVVTGLGEFIAAEAARAAGLAVHSLAGRLGNAAQVAPAVAVAWLLQEAAESA
jgi:(4-(4-[2-(gamma-L-glutamylamino)ethyl]phenoxymethyl)furan-2-yl)methanamine synthase